MALWMEQTDPGTSLSTVYTATKESTILNASVCNTTGTATTLTIAISDGVTSKTKYHELAVAGNSSGISLGLLVNQRLTAGSILQAQAANASTVTLSVSGEAST